MTNEVNIFYLSTDPYTAAEYHCDKHCVKMIVESAQLLSTAHRLLDNDKIADDKNLYKSFSPNHPCAIWTRENHRHYMWLFWLMNGLCIEYTLRYDKVHKVSETGLRDQLREPPDNIIMDAFSPPPQCMPDKYKTQNTVQAYRNYYLGEKATFAQWRLNKPKWWKGEN